ncbi:MAG TPA: hypothetical protein VFA10_11460 [Ktedonobacteraceae bacterium]|nr:hypothetical protein [Ktedonobacteraceae bacterium]
MVDTLYPTLDAHREKLQSRVYASWPVDVLRGRLASLADAYRYHIDTNTLLATSINPHVRLRAEKNLWIELTAPLRDELLAGVRVPTFKGEMVDRYEWLGGEASITAMYYRWPAWEAACQDTAYPVTGRYDLELITDNGSLLPAISYYTIVKRWAIPCFDRCEKCGHQEHTLRPAEMQEPCVTPCPRCDSYLNTWRNRFRQALTIIQAKK